MERNNVHHLILMSYIHLFIYICLYPIQFAASLTGGSFEESRMLKNVEACEWLTGAIRSLEVPNLDPCYVNMRAVSYLYLSRFLLQVYNLLVHGIDHAFMLTLQNS
jgi:hypothetical protein